MVPVLIGAGADVNAADEHGGTALMLAVGEGHAAIARVLIESGADVNARSQDGFTALMFAAGGGHLECVRLCLDAGADVSARTREGRSAWDLARHRAGRSFHFGDSLWMFGKRVRDSDPILQALTRAKAM